MITLWGVVNCAVTASLLSLLCVGWAEAGATYIPSCDENKSYLPCLSGLVLYEKDDPKTRTIVLENPCLAMMEAAMKAMEPFSVINLPPEPQLNLSLLHIHKGWATLPAEELEKFTPYGLTQTLNAKAGRAIVLWQDAKRDCWQSGR